MHIKQIVAATMMAVGTLSASAAATDWAAHDPVEFGLGFAVGAGSSIHDTYSFSLGASSTLVTTAVSNESSALDLTGATVFLYKGSVGSGSFVSGFGFDSSSITATITPLVAGLYYYLVTATVGGGAVAGSYALTSQAIPVPQVPEPQTAAMLAAGLATMGFLAMRRRNA